ncbi:MAG: ATP-binding protein [Myxococcota bacterium]|nr:ATP-binding protein [Myxococcota bacterium]
MVTTPSVDFARVFDASPSLFVVLAPDLTVLAVNEAYLQGTGHSRDMVGRNFVEVLGDSGSDEPNATTVRNLRASLAAVVETKARDQMPPQRFDVRRPALSGGGLEERHWRPVNTPVLGADGSLEYVLHCVGESTERARLDRQKNADDVRAEAVRLETETDARQAMDQLGASVDQQPQTLLDSDIRFRAIYDNALDAMVIADDEGRIIDANVAATVLFGRERSDILSLRVFDLLPEPDPADGPCAQLKNAPSQRGERRIVLPDGRVIHVEFSARSAFLPGRHLSVLRDIDERRHTEEVLRFLAEASAVLARSLDYRTTLESLAQVVVPTWAEWSAVDMVVGDGSLRRAAAAHVDHSKVDAAKELGNLWTGRPDEASSARHAVHSLRPVLAAEVSEECLAGLVADPAALRLARSLGMRSWMHLPLIVREECIGVLTLVAGDSGRRFGPADVSVAEDLARRAASAIENAQLFTKSRDALEARDEFLQIASHELNTPLTSLKLQVAMLQRAGLEGKQRDHVQAAARQVDRIGNLVEGLLDVTRVVAGQLLLTRAPVELGRLLRDVVALIADDARTSGVDLRVRTDKVVVGSFDGARLAQAIANCIVNAIKYGAGKPVEISLDSADGMATITVRDRGIGIDPTMHARIFDRFVRASSAQNYGGFGLGLWIARQIVEASGGTISVASVVGEGATFRIDLPLVAADTPRPLETHGAAALLS